MISTYRIYNLLLFLSSSFLLECVDEDRRFIGAITYEQKEGVNSPFDDPYIQILAADDFRYWRNANPETKNIICLLPLNVQFELVCRQQYVSGFDEIDITPPAVVYPKESTITCKPLSDRELLYLNEYYGHNGENYIPKHADVSIAKFIAKVSKARYQFCSTQLERKGTIMKMFNQSDLTDYFVLQNMRELPLDVSQDFNAFYSFKRIRHDTLTKITEFQTDRYLELNGEAVGVFYDIGTNQNHTKIKMQTTTKLNLISHKYNNVIRGTFLHLPRNDKNRFVIRTDGHCGHTIKRSIAVPKPVMVVGASIWDISDQSTPKPIYKKETTKKLAGKRIFARTPSYSPRMTLMGKKSMTKPNSNPSDNSLDNIDYNSPQPGPSNLNIIKTKAKKVHIVEDNLNKNKDNEIRVEKDSTCLPVNKTTVSDILRPHEKMTFIFGKTSLPNTSNKSPVETRGVDEGLKLVLDDLSRLQDQFKNQFNQLLLGYKTQIISPTGTIIPDQATITLLMNEISTLARAIKNNSNDMDTLRDHLIQAIFGIVGTYFSNEINQQHQINRIDISNLTPTITLQNEIVAYMDNIHNSLLSFRPFPKPRNSNCNEVETKLLKCVKDFFENTTPFIHLFREAYENTRSQIINIINSSNTPESNSPVITPPKHSSQKPSEAKAPSFVADPSVDSDLKSSDTASAVNLGSTTLDLFTKTNTQPMLESQKSNASSDTTVEEIVRSQGPHNCNIDGVVDLTDDDKTPSGLDKKSTSSSGSNKTNSKSKSKPRFTISSDDSDIENKNKNPVRNLKRHNKSPNPFGPSNKKNKM